MSEAARHSSALASRAGGHILGGTASLVGSGASDSLSLDNEEVGPSMSASVVSCVHVDHDVEWQFGKGPEGPADVNEDYVAGELGGGVQ